MCHSGPMFSDYKLHNIGVANTPKLDAADEGIEGKFRTPSLRNLASTGSYMHNGMEATLNSAVAFYEGLDKSLDPDLQQLDFDDDDIGSIVAFLKSLRIKHLPPSKYHKIIQTGRKKRPKIWSTKSK